MSVFGGLKQSKSWDLKRPEYVRRPISFKGLHQQEGHDDYSGDFDGVHIDFDEKCTVLIDIKYAPKYPGVLNPRTQRAFEVQANAATAGGQRTYVLIAGHDVDLRTEGAEVPIGRCRAIEVYYPESRVWHAHAQDKAGMNGVSSLPLDLSAPAVVHRLKVFGHDLDLAAGERVRCGQRSQAELWEAVMARVALEDTCPPYLRKGITYGGG
jgi:hypothetical protein